MTDAALSFIIPILRNEAMLIKSNWFMRSGYVASNPFFLLLVIYILFAAHHNYSDRTEANDSTVGARLRSYCPWTDCSDS